MAHARAGTRSLLGPGDGEAKRQKTSRVTSKRVSAARDIIPAAYTQASYSGLCLRRAATACVGRVVADSILLCDGRMADNAVDCMLLRRLWLFEEISSCTYTRLAANHYALVLFSVAALAAVLLLVSTCTPLILPMRMWARVLEVYGNTN